VNIEKARIIINYIWLFPCNIPMVENMIASHRQRQLGPGPPNNGRLQAI
jgi:hypothetical protein